MEGQSHPFQVPVLVWINNRGLNHLLWRLTVDSDGAGQNCSQLIDSLVKDNVTVLDFNLEPVALIQELLAISRLRGLHDDKEIVQAVNLRIADGIAQFRREGQEVVRTVILPGRSC